VTDATSSRGSDYAHRAFISTPHPPFLSFPREYDNLKGSLKSINDLSEKLKREVLTSNNKVTFIFIKVTAREAVLECGNSLNQSL